MCDTYQYLGPFNYVQMNEKYYIELELDSNACIHLTV